MTAAVVAGLIAGYGVAIPIGAIAPLLMSLTARTSLRVGAAAALGVAAADGVYALVAVLGGASLSRWIQPVAVPLRWIAVVILLYLAVRIALSALRKPGEVGLNVSTPLRAFGALLGLTLLNPTTILYFGALVLGWQASGGFNGAMGAVWIAAVFVASASWQLLIAGGGALLGKTLNTPKGRLWTALISSLMIGGLALAIVM
ncbi:LysE/ArgO family amino acid transporter [Allorhizocola rhizosphaerae]|uniref:LysE/ArgO family amino acid transporter n=1 Tax=Allorhizocola rhizosphaerae TaxID=1872709 RepID=UPI000E3BEBCB|nr:LysE family transporter [Allorhizocola rhizosphaerae]